MPVQPFFLDTQAGARFCVYRSSSRTPVLGAVLHVPPFAEEMNKARRMTAVQARALAAAGYDVLQLDLGGCGDSAGDHGEARWDGWIADVQAAAAWLHGKSGAEVPLWLWGLRSGCLLAAAAAHGMPTPCNFLFWQPTPAGKPLVQQFLRLKMAGELLGGEAKGITEELRRQLASGQSIEVAGYALSPALVQGMEAAELMPPAQEAGRLEWLEVSSRPEPALMPISEKWLGRWRDAGFATQSHVAAGPAFWQTTEIEEAPALVDMTLAALEGAVANTEAAG